MVPHRNDAAAKIKNTRIPKLLKWCVLLPIPCVLLSYGWIKRLFVRPRTEAEQRTAEKQRQAGIRRELRGLPAKHDGEIPVTPLKPRNYATNRS